MEGTEVNRKHALETAEKLHRIADAIASGKAFHMKIGGNQMAVPPNWLLECEVAEVQNTVCLRVPSRRRVGGNNVAPST